jgi:hypothetical protein
LKIFFVSGVFNKNVIFHVLFDNNLVKALCLPCHSAMQAFLGWGSTGSFYLLAEALVMILKQCGLELKSYYLYKIFTIFFIGGKLEVRL